MIKPEVDFELLQRYIKTLYDKAGQLNLYICRCHSKNFPDVERLRFAMENMKKNIRDIEKEIYRI